eukprot:1251043-Ditylum_brightwellii.AAC.1
MERNRDLTCENVGYVVLLHHTFSDESVHLQNHESYRKEISRKGVNRIRKVSLGFEMSTSNKVPLEFQSVIWNDGDIMTLSAIVKEEIQN